MSSSKIFNEYSTENITCKDKTLVPHINYGWSRVVPHSSVAFSKKPFFKSTAPIVERLVNRLMLHGRNCGKKLKAIGIVRSAFAYMTAVTNENPIQLLVDAIVYGSPREHTARVGGGANAKRASVDVSPLYRVNCALNLMTTGAREASLRSVRTIAECLGDEIINAAKNSQNSYAVRKKEEFERSAKSNR